MQTTGPQSSNVQDYSGNQTAWFAPHQNPFTNPVINASRLQDAAAYNQWAQQRLQQMLQNPGNPFYHMLQGMNKPLPPANPMARIPIPTPRPDPSIPYQKPTVWGG